MLTHLAQPKDSNLLLANIFRLFLPREPMDASSIRQRHSLKYFAFIFLPKIKLGSIIQQVRIAQVLPELLNIIVESGVIKEVKRNSTLLWTTCI